MAKKKKQTDFPKLCKTCMFRDSDSAYCAGYAVRAALNDLKKAFTEPIDAFMKRKPRDYDYGCDNYMEDRELEQAE